MENDFILVGPPDDPAALATRPNIAEALKNIAGAGRFVSRGDESGTHQKEKSLWKALGGRPGGEWYVEAGAGMGRTLLIADELRAYTLSDRGTYLAFRGKISSRAVLQNDPRLRNLYSVMAVNPARHPHVRGNLARRFVEWLAAPATQRRIGKYRYYGEVLFIPRGGRLIMDISAATAEAFRLLFSGDPGLWEIVGISLAVSGAALFVAAFPALALAYGLARGDFFGRRALFATLQGLLSFPTVAVGLVLYMLLSRQGPLGAWGILFTPQAMALGQAIIAFPVAAVFATAALQKNDPRLRETAMAFGAGPLRVFWHEVKEARFGLFAALLAAFGRVISEVGCALMVGGNIAHYTRNMTAAIALETGKGFFAEGIALGIVLVSLALLAGALLAGMQGSGR